MVDNATPSASTKLLSDLAVQRFIVDGYLLLQADCEPAVHSLVHEQLDQVLETESWPGNNILARIPMMHAVLNCSAVTGALTSLLGPDYLVHPHRAVHRSNPVASESAHPIATDIRADGTPMGSGSTAASVWHQDAQSPLARARHHLPRHLIGFYFPHETPRSMGPTRLQAGSYLWPHPPAQATGVVMPDRLPAGSFMLVHFDMVHAGFANLSQQTRYMVKFVFNRMSPPSKPTWAHTDAAWLTPTHEATEKLEPAWQHIWHWLLGTPQQHTAGDVTALQSSDFATAITACYRRYSPDELAQALVTHAGKNRHKRLLLPSGDASPPVKDDIEGYPRRWNERAVVMQNETYALAAQGPDAISTLLGLTEHSDPWIQVNAVFALGEIGTMNAQVEHALLGLLDSPEQVVVRQTIDTIACIHTKSTVFLPRFEHLLLNPKTDWRQPLVGRGWTAHNQIKVNIMFACASLIGTETDTETLQALLTLGLEDDGYIAEIAVAGLRRIGTATALAQALEYCAERTWDVALLGAPRGY